jgi:transcriptional regulator with XRE-family HTH domain
MEIYIRIFIRMRNTAVNVKELREKLGLNQLELAGALCVTQATVARWESRNGRTQPTGDAARRLQHLQAMMAIPKENKVLRETLKSAGGVSAVAALLSLGSSVDATALGLAGVGALFGPLGIAGGVAGGLLYRLLQKAHENKKGKENTK